MTNLLLKTKTELFKWQRERERERERERQRERERENSEKLKASILFPCFNSKFICEQHSRLLPEHVNMLI